MGPPDGWNMGVGPRIPARGLWRTPGNGAIFELGYRERELGGAQTGTLYASWAITRTPGALAAPTAVLWTRPCGVEPHGVAGLAELPPSSPSGCPRGGAFSSCPAW